MTETFITAIVLYPGVTQLDFTGPHEFLWRLPDSEVVLTSTRGGELPLSGGLTVSRLVPLAEVPRCDLLLVPGGYGTVDAMLDGELLAGIRRLAEGARYVSAVCTGSLVLAAAGLLRNKRAACHWAWRELLGEFGVRPDPGRVVRDGNVYTGGGVTAGIDLALAVAADVAGREFAEALELSLEYAPAPPFACGSPELAPPGLVQTIRDRIAARSPERATAARLAAERLTSAKA